VLAISRGKTVLGYGVYDAIGGMESEHSRYMLKDYSADVALHLANTDRDDRNASAKGEAVS
jgi:hypothetical protein